MSEMTEKLVAKVAVELGVTQERARELLDEAEAHILAIAVVHSTYRDRKLTDKEATCCLEHMGFPTDYIPIMLAQWRWEFQP